MYRGRVLWLIVAVLSCGGPVLAQNDEAPVRYDGYKIVRVSVGSPEQLDQLHALGARLMNDSEGVGTVDYLLAPEAMLGLDVTGIAYTVLNDNIQRDIDAERARLAAQPEPDPRDRGWFDDYKNIDAVNAKLNAMVADRPDLASLLDIGLTLQGRHIYGIRITGPGTDKPGVEFDGCHHAREWVTVMVPMWIADKLVYTYDTDPNVQSLVNSLEFYIIPVLNVDGYVYSWSTDRLWRKNRRLNAGGCYGVDDNRNYSVGFGGGGSSGDPCSEIYRGTAAFSEPETAALRDFTMAHPNIVTAQSYHSYSQLFMSPYGYTSALPADHPTFMQMNADCVALIYAVHGMSYDYGPIYSTIYQASGGTVDWMYDAEGIFSFTTELRDTGYYGFELPPDQIIPTCEENFPAALYLANWSTSPVKFSFPAGFPTRLDPGVPYPMQVKIMVVGGTLDPNSPLLYARIGGSGAFTAYTLTPLGGGVFEATLPATPCGQTLYYYFAAATTTGITAFSPADAPNSTYSAPAQPLITILDLPLNTTPGWAIEGSWAFGHPTGGGGSHGARDPNNGHTGTNVYGYNLTGGYTNNMPERNLTTTTINCAGITGAKLSFWRWLGVEENIYDHAYLKISNNNGSTWNTVWQNGPATIDDGAWVYQEYDIATWANNQPNVKLRWTLGTTDGAWTYCGWNIDDVKIWANDPNGCPTTPGDLNCDGLVDFDDINPFVLAVSDPAAYLAAYPTCNILNGDCNGDGIVDFDDINPFVVLLSGQ
jgi:murein tripeptide amidase MpaA